MRLRGPRPGERPPTLTSDAAAGRHRPSPPAGAYAGGTVTLDFRTRTAGETQPVDAAELFEHVLPALVADRAGLALPGARELDPRPLAIRVGEDAWTLTLGADTVEIRPGDTAAKAAWVLDGEGLTDLVNDVRTPMGFFTGGALEMPLGGLEDALDWWVILRSLIDARPVHTSGAVAFGELDLQRGFGPEESPEEMAEFLAVAGFLRLTGVFSEQEMAAVSEEIDEAAPRYQPDDGRSWWARTADGQQRLVRLQYFQGESPTTARLLQDDRFVRIGRLTDDGHRTSRFGSDGNVIEALVKPLGVVAGISDLPWHKDCSLGGHSFQCCSLVVGISVTGADAATGQLRVVAGSHRALIQPAFVRCGLDLPQIDLPTRTGDVTVHLSCTLHMSQAPVTAERRVMYTALRLPDRGGLSAADSEKLSRIREGATANVSQRPSPLARSVAG